MLPSFQQQDGSRLWAGKGFIIRIWGKDPMEVSIEPYRLVATQKFSILQY